MERATSTNLRTRWAAVGAAIAVTLGAGGIGISHATTTSGTRAIYRALEPCRLTDTRPEFQVGPRSSPLGPNETETLQGWNAAGDCDLPSETAALALNVTAVEATQPTFLTLFPADADLPTASHLNPTPGSPPAPNAVNVALDDTGAFKIYNLAGSVHVVIDVVGVFDDHTHDDRYYTEAEIDASRTVTVGHNHWGMSWVGATTAALFNNCQRKPTATGFEPGRLLLTPVPVGATIVSGTAYIYDTPGSATHTVNWWLDSIASGLNNQLLDSASGGGSTSGLRIHEFELDPPVVVDEGDSMYLSFNSGSDRHGFCGFDLTYVLPEI